MTTDERADDTGEHDDPAEDAVAEEQDDDAADLDDADVDADDADADAADGPSWWHRDHPVFTPLSGFFTGLATVVLLPGLFAALLSQIFDYSTAEDLFPFVALLLVVPLVLLTMERTRRFGRYMLAGMVLTALVVVAVAALTLWLLVQLDG